MIKEMNPFDIRSYRKELIIPCTQAQIRQLILYFPRCSCPDRDMLPWVQRK